MCKTITVDGEWKGVRGKPTSNSLSFSITKSVVTKHPVDVTSPCIARGCRPMLQLHYPHRSDVWTAQYATSERGGVCVGGTGTGRRACGRVSLQSPLVSPTTPPLPAWRRLTGACQEPEHGRTGDPVCSGPRWSPAFDCTRRRCCCSTTNSSTL